jgi:transglutaminase-like putative cysteine protease
MPILTVRHVTTYHYRQPVAFGDHRMMLRPRDDDDQKVLESQLEITPGPSHLTWTRDIFGNHVATARFADRASELRFESTIRVNQAPAGFRAADIVEFARTYPFAYAAEDRPDHAHFVTPPSTHPWLDRWAASFLRADGSADTRELLVGITQTIRRTFKHVTRHEKGTLDPIQTLKLASGSCRDLAMFMIAALRSLGIAARFVSGYLHLADDDDDRLTGGNTHAWVQAYIPGPGWVDFDPSSGMIRQSEPRTRRCRTETTRSDSCARHVDWDRVRPSRHEGRGQGHGGGGCRRRTWARGHGVMLPAGRECRSPGSSARASCRGSR